MPCLGAQPSHIGLRIVPTHTDDGVSSGLRKPWRMPIAVRSNEGCGRTNRSAAIGVRPICLRHKLSVLISRHVKFGNCELVWIVIKCRGIELPRSSLGRFGRASSPAGAPIVNLPCCTTTISGQPFEQSRNDVPGAGVCARNCSDRPAANATDESGIKLTVPRSADKKDRRSAAGDAMRHAMPPIDLHE